MEGTVSLWVGIDWASEEHQVCAVNAQGHKVFEEKVRHSGDGITQFVDRLLERVGGQADQLAVAMETPRGAIVEALIDRNVAAFSLNPIQLERFRDRYRVSGAKSDAIDAFVLANSLRTDRPAYRRIVLGEATIVELRELRRAHTALTRDATALGARLREQLHRYYPQILQLGSPYDESWVWELLEQALTPTQGARLSHAKVESLLRRHHIRAVTAEKVVAMLRSKALPVAPGVVAAASGHVQLLLPLIRTHRQQLAACMHRIDTLLAQLTTPPSEAPGRRRRGANTSGCGHPAVGAGAGTADECHAANRGLASAPGARLRRVAFAVRGGPGDVADWQTAPAPDPWPPPQSARLHASCLQ